MTEQDKSFEDMVRYGTGTMLDGNRVPPSDIKVETRVFPSGLIEQDTTFDGSRLRWTRHIVDTQESQVREALIKLGWTPP